MVWDLLRTKKEKPAAGKTGYWRTFWRRRWDSNPRTLADQLISSQSRYDHFDTSPYLSQHQHLRKRGELMGRTSKNIKLRISEKPRKIKGFRSGSYRIATTISSPTSYKQMCVICGRSHPLCCTQTKLYLQGFSDYITKTARVFEPTRSFQKSVFLSMLGRHRADLGQTSSPRNSLTYRSIVEIFYYREVRYEYETRATYQLG